MAENKFLNKARINLILLMTILYLIGRFILTLWLPEYDFGYYPLIPIFYVILGLVILTSIVKVSCKDAKKYTLVFLASRSVKLILMSSACLMYVFVVGEHNLSFIVTFLIYYLCYSVYESRALMKLNRSLHEYAETNK